MTRNMSGGTLTALVAWTVLSCSASARPDAAAPTTAAARHLEEWRRDRIGVYMNDFAELGHYREANARQPPPVAGESRVVFFGDSITEAWPLDSAFPGKPDLNRRVERYCRANGLVYLDYFSAMVNEQGRMRQELADQGLHPNADGYAVMTPLAARAIEQALAGS